jgi:hypothetical protein
MGPLWQIVDRDLECRTGGAEAPVSSCLCWPGFAFDRERVRELGVPAYCWTPAGELWEYEDAVFFVTGSGDRGERRRAEAADAPREGWSHPADCACAVCRAEKR